MIYIYLHFLFPLRLVMKNAILINITLCPCCCLRYINCQNDLRNPHVTSLFTFPCTWELLKPTWSAKSLLRSLGTWKDFKPVSHTNWWNKLHGELHRLFQLLSTDYYGVRNLFIWLHKYSSFTVLGAFSRWVHKNNNRLLGSHECPVLGLV